MEIDTVKYDTSLGKSDDAELGFDCVVSETVKHRPRRKPTPKRIISYCTMAAIS